MQIVLNSEVWKIIDDGTVMPDEGGDGNVDFSIRTILVHPNIRPECRLKVLVHEMLHASCDWIEESVVTRVAEDISRALYHQYKYRCPKPKGQKQ